MHFSDVRIEYQEPDGRWEREDIEVVTPHYRGAHGHEPDNRFLECALAASAEFIVTVNAAPGHVDRKQYQSVNVARPNEFLNVPEVARL